MENVCLAHAWNVGQAVSYWREAPLEVDGIVEGSWGTWAMEVKTGRYETKDLQGLLEVSRRNPQFRSLVVCGSAGIATAERAGVSALTWQEFLLEGPPRTG